MVREQLDQIIARTECVEQHCIHASASPYGDQAKARSQLAQS
jgi:hypothetical protein